MFKNRAIQLKFVKPDKQQSLPGEGGTVTYHPDYLAEVATNVVTHTALVVGGTFAAYKVIDTVCKIAVIGAKAITR